jgi:outer membrane protein OmpA-like peptidoglycan-associated protein
MKRSLMTFALALALSAAVMAQNPPTTSTTPDQKPAATDQQQPASTSQPSSQPADNSAMPAQQQQAPATAQAAPEEPQPKKLEVRKEGFWGKLNPFARKKYVQRQIQPVQDQVNELDQLTKANAKMIQDVDSRAQQGIQLASTKAGEADAHAMDAQQRAQTANQTAQQASDQLQTVQKVVNNIDQYHAESEVEIRFRSGQTALSKRAKDALDEMAEPLKQQKGYVIQVQGFARGRGQEAIATSQQLADSVVRYLVLNHEIPVYRIYVVGMGNAPLTTPDGEKVKRSVGGTVEIAVLRNDSEQLGSQTGAPAATQPAPATSKPQAQPQPDSPK